jgi:hypothetical protein
VDSPRPDEDDSMVHSDDAAIDFIDDGLLPDSEFIELEPSQVGCRYCIGEGVTGIKCISW